MERIRATSQDNGPVFYDGWFGYEVTKEMKLKILNKQILDAEEALAEFNCLHSMNAGDLFERSCVSVHLQDLYRQRKQASEK